jgi:CBS domain-containing protein
MVMVTVGQLMKRNLVTVDAGTPVLDAAKLMKAYNVGSVLVAASNRIVGIVTESDIVRKVISEERPYDRLPVETIMSAPVVGIEERRPITEAADLMHKHRTRHLGVTKGGALVGMVSVRDFLRPVSVDDL